MILRGKGRGEERRRGWGQERREGWGETAAHMDVSLGVIRQSKVLEHGSCPDNKQNHVIITQSLIPRPISCDLGMRLDDTQSHVEPASRSISLLVFWCLIHSNS